MRRKCAPRAAAGALQAVRRAARRDRAGVGTFQVARRDGMRATLEAAA